MNFKDIISIAAVIAKTEVQAKEKFDRYFIFTKLNETRLTETK